MRINTKVHTLHHNKQLAHNGCASTQNIQATHRITCFVVMLINQATFPANKNMSKKGRLLIADSQTIPELLGRKIKMVLGSEPTRQMVYMNTQYNLLMELVKLAYNFIYPR